MARIQLKLQDLQMLVSLFFNRVNRIEIIDPKNEFKHRPKFNMSHEAEESAGIFLAEGHASSSNHQYVLDFTGKSEGTSYYYVLDEQHEIKVLYTSENKEFPIDHAFKFGRLPLPSFLSSFIFRIGLGKYLADGIISVKSNENAPAYRVLGNNYPEWLMTEVRDGQALILAKIGSTSNGEQIARIVTSAQSADWLMYQKAKRKQMDQLICNSTQLHSPDAAVQIVQLNQENLYRSILADLTPDKLQAHHTTHSYHWKELEKKALHNNVLKTDLERYFSSSQKSALMTTTWMPLSLANKGKAHPGEHLQLIQMPLFFPLFAKCIHGHDELRTFSYHLLKTIRKDPFLRKIWSYNNEMKRQLAIFLLKEIQSHPEKRNKYIEWIEELNTNPIQVNVPNEIKKTLRNLRYSILEFGNLNQKHVHIAIHPAHLKRAFANVKLNPNLTLLRSSRGNGYTNLDIKTLSGDRFSLRFTTAIRYKNQEIMDILPLLRSIVPNNEGQPVSELRFRVEFEWLRFQLDGKRGNEILNEMLNKAKFSDQLSIINYMNSKYNLEITRVHELIRPIPNEQLLNKIRQIIPMKFGRKLVFGLNEWFTGKLKFNLDFGYIIQINHTLSIQEKKDIRKFLQREIIVQNQQKHKKPVEQLKTLWHLFRGKVVLVEHKYYAINDPFIHDELSQQINLKIAS